MDLLATFNDNEFEPTDYTDRLTVKAVILNDNDEVLLFSKALPGGGVEDGETNEEALSRELMEEIGAKVSIVRELGRVIAYRDALKLKYIFIGYQCSLISLGEPTTIQKDELQWGPVWDKRVGVISRLEQEIATVKTKGREVYDLETYQRKIFNRKTAILFLKGVDK